MCMQRQSPLKSFSRVTSACVCILPSHKPGRSWHAATDPENTTPQVRMRLPVPWPKKVMYTQISPMGLPTDLAGELKRGYNLSPGTVHAGHVSAADSHLSRTPAWRFLQLCDGKHAYTDRATVHPTYLKEKGYFANLESTSWHGSNSGRWSRHVLLLLRSMWWPC